MKVQELLQENELVPPKVLAEVTARFLRELYDVIEQQKSVDMLRISPEDEGTFVCVVWVEKRPANVRLKFGTNDFNALLKKYHLQGALTISKFEEQMHIGLQIDVEPGWTFDFDLLQQQVTKAFHDHPEIPQF